MASNEKIDRIITEAINNFVNEAAGTLTSKKLTAKRSNTFNKDEVLKKALSYNTPSELYKDERLCAMLRYHGLLDYVKQEFAKANKYLTHKRGGSRLNDWTPKSALKYASKFLNGYELTMEPMGRSCFHYLKTRDKNGNKLNGDPSQIPLINFAFKAARKKDGEKASEILYQKELEAQRSRERASELAAERVKNRQMKAQERAKQIEANKKQKIIDKDLAKKKTYQDVIDFVKQNGIMRRVELKNANPNYYYFAVTNGMLNMLFGDMENSRNINDMRRIKMSLAKSESPSHLRRYSPPTYKRLMQNGKINQYYPNWQIVNGKWTKIK